MKCFSFILLFCALSFSQNLEEEIYTSIDEFVAKPNASNLKIIQSKTNQYKNLITSKEEKLAYVILLCNKGYYEKQFNQIKNAISSYEEGLNIFEKNKLTQYDIVEYNLKPLGHLYTITKNLSLAESTIKKYIFLAEKQKNIHQKTSGILNLSVVYNNSGNYKTAIALLKKELSKSHLSKEERKNLENNLATNLIAIKEFEKANNLLNQKSDYQTLKNKSFIALQKNDFKTAIKLLESSKKEFLKNNISAREYAKFLIDESFLYKIANQPTKQRKALNQALKILKPNSNISDYAEQLFVIIYDELAFLESDLSKKLEYLDQAFEVKSLIYNNISSQETLLIIETEDKKRTEYCLEICYQLYKETNNSSFLEKALLYTENHKNISLKQNYFSALLKDKNYNKRKKLLQQKDQLINELIRNEIKFDQNVNIEKINTELNRLEIEIKKLSSSQRLNQLDIIFLNKIFRKADAKDVIINYYFYGSKNIYIFTIDSQINLKTIKIDNKTKNQFLEYINFFNSPELINNRLENFKTKSLQVYQKLNIPKTDKKIIIIPDGILNFIPYESLLTKAYNGKNYSKMPFLIRNNKISYQSNLVFFERSINKPKDSNKIVGFFPVFKGTNYELPYTLSEAEILKDFNAKIYLNNKATKNNFLKEIQSANILHIGTHGTSGNFNNPSALLFYDDQVFLQELNNLEAKNCDFVLLSACETGVGKLQKGEGAMSISRGFQMANVPNLMFTLWEINDFTTSKIITNFYNSFRENNSYYESNYLSKINYLDDDVMDNSKKSPYYWSSFVYYGEIDDRNDSYLYVLASCILLSLIIFIYRKLIFKFIKVNLSK